MNSKRSIILLTLVITGFLLMTGCTSSPPVEKPATPLATAVPATLPPTPEETVTPEPVIESEKEVTIFNGPVTQPPDELSISVSAQKDPVYNKITAVFDGGKGQQLLKAINVRVTASDGTVTELPLDTKRGSEVEFSGTKGADRLQAAVDYKNGASYLILDQTFGKVRADDPTTTPTVAPVTEALSGGKYDGPITQPPKNLDVYVDLEKDPVYRVITATFRGGHGQTLVKTIDVHAHLSDGTEVTEKLANNIGNVAEIQETAGNDKVQVVVFYKNGEQYKISEKVFGPRG